MEHILTINVKTEAPTFINGAKMNILSIPFTAEAVGPCFFGKTVGVGVDTQKIEKDGEAILSARYILRGKDADGEECSLFIENNGKSLDDCTPTVVTDSKSLSYLESAELKATVTPENGGVTVRIYKI